MGIQQRTSLDFESRSSIKKIQRLCLNFIIIVDTLNKFFPVFDDVSDEDLGSTVTCNSNKIQKWRNYKVVFV
ncbi:hypothetical protein T07_7112, partial [Trichinella nelsoni]